VMLIIPPEPTEGAILPRMLRVDAVPVIGPVNERVPVIVVDPKVPVVSKFGTPPTYVIAIEPPVDVILLNAVEIVLRFNLQVFSVSVTAVSRMLI
jgi:hypothetical protein